MTPRLKFYCSKKKGLFGKKKKNLLVPVHRVNEDKSCGNVTFNNNVLENNGIKI